MTGRLIYILFVVAAFGCRRAADSNGESTSRVVARAGDEQLDIETFSDGYLESGVISDSVYNAKKSIEKWATESFFYQEAIEKLTDDEMDIEKQVEGYRKSLVNYIYQVRIIEANLDTIISPQEITEYYNAHRDNFILKENIVKVNYFKVPVKASSLPKIRSLSASSRPKDSEQLIVLLNQNAENYFMNDSTWLFLDDIKKEIPQVGEQPDLNFAPGRVYEFSDEQYFYHLRIRDIKIKNGLSPLNFERNNIRKFIINSRKTQLINEYKKELFERAKAAKKFEMF